MKRLLFFCAAVWLLVAALPVILGVSLLVLELMGVLQSPFSVTSP